MHFTVRCMSKYWSYFNVLNQSATIYCIDRALVRCIDYDSNFARSFPVKTAIDLCSWSSWKIESFVIFFILLLFSSYYSSTLFNWLQLFLKLLDDTWVRLTSKNDGKRRHCKATIWSLSPYAGGRSWWSRLPSGTFRLQDRPDTWAAGNRRELHLICNQIKVKISVFQTHD